MRFSSRFSERIFLLLLAVTLPGRSALAGPSEDHNLPMAHKQGNPVLVSVTDSEGRVRQRGMGSVIELDGNYYLVGNKDVFQGVQGMTGGESSSAGPKGVTVFYPWITRKPDGTTGNPVYNCSSTDGRIAVIHGDIGILQLRANPDVKAASVHVSSLPVKDKMKVKVQYAAINGGKASTAKGSDVKQVNEVAVDTFTDSDVRAWIAEGAAQGENAHALDAK